MKKQDRRDLNMAKWDKRAKFGYEGESTIRKHEHQILKGVMTYQSRKHCRKNDR